MPSTRSGTQESEPKSSKSWKVLGLLARLRVARSASRSLSASDSSQTFCCALVGNPSDSEPQRDTAVAAPCTQFVGALPDARALETFCCTLREAGRPFCLPGSPSKNVRGSTYTRASSRSGSSNLATGALKLWASGSCEILPIRPTRTHSVLGGEACPDVPIIYFANGGSSYLRDQVRCGATGPTPIWTSPRHSLLSGHCAGWPHRCPWHRWAPRHCLTMSSSLSAMPSMRVLEAHALG